jgi:lantibiotic modifying enzyme
MHCHFFAYALALLQCKISEFSALNRSNPARLEFRDFGGQLFRISCINKIEILVGRRSKNRKSDLLRVLIETFSSCKASETIFVGGAKKRKSEE